MSNLASMIQTYPFESLLEAGPMNDERRWFAKVFKRGMGGDFLCRPSLSDREERLELLIFRP